MTVFRNIENWTGDNTGLVERVHHKNAEGNIISSYEELTDKPLINGVILQGDLSLDELNVQPKGDYVSQEDIPSKISELENDKGYLTNIPEEYVTEEKLDEKGYLTEHQDLSGYAKNTDIPTKVSQLTNDKNYITSIPEEYITENELNAKGFITSFTENDPTVPTHVKSIKASDINNWNAKSEFSGSYNDLTNKPTIPSTDGLATEEYVTKAIADLVGTAPEALDTLAELAEGLTANRDVVELLNDSIVDKASKTELDSLREEIGMELFLRLTETTSAETLAALSRMVTASYQKRKPFIVACRLEGKDPGLYVGCVYSQSLQIDGEPMNNFTYYYANNTTSRFNQALRMRGTWTDGVYTCTSASISNLSGTPTYLGTANTFVYTPTGDYNPATKKYVDDSVAAIPTSGSGITEINTSTKAYELEAGYYIVNGSTENAISLWWSTGSRDIFRNKTYVLINKEYSYMDAFYVNNHKIVLVKFFDNGQESNQERYYIDVDKLATTTYVDNSIATVLDTIATLQSTISDLESRIAALEGGVE